MGLHNTQISANQNWAILRIAVVWLLANVIRQFVQFQFYRLTECFSQFAMKGKNAKLTFISAIMPMRATFAFTFSLVPLTY
jgi:hypothetical protein